MNLSATSRRALAGLTALVLSFIYVPLGIVLINSFNASQSFGWPPREFTTRWWSATWGNEGVRAAVVASVQVALAATAIALVLGSLLAFAISRYDFWGKHSISFLVALPIALPGIVTGIALNSAFANLGLALGYLTVVVGHATFCIVVVFNNVAARLRRTGTSLQEASADLGATPTQTFRWVTLPQIRSSLLAGGLLAFALSFDEIVVTTFTTSPGLQTLPIWIFGNLFRPNQAPVVNVVAVLMILLSVVPLWLAQRMTRES